MQPNNCVRERIARKMEWDSLRLSRGLTLIEILTATAIVVVLSGIVLAVIAGARKSAYATNSMSNTKQCVTALLIYSSDWGELPAGVNAIEPLKNAPTCDPMDHWRDGCTIDFGPPMVGSYGYIRMLKRFQSDVEWSQYESIVENPPLIASIWNTEYKLAPVRGEDPILPGNPLCRAYGACWFPTRITYARQDGSALFWKGRKWSVTDDVTSGWSMCWSNIFAEELFTSHKQ